MKISLYRDTFRFKPLLDRHHAMSSVAAEYFGYTWAIVISWLWFELILCGDPKP